jgi:hypothetical protein
MHRTRSPAVARPVAYARRDGRLRPTLRVDCAVAGRLGESPSIWLVRAAGPPHARTPLVGPGQPPGRPLVSIQPGGREERFALGGAWPALPWPLDRLQRRTSRPADRSPGGSTALRGTRVAGPQNVCSGCARGTLGPSRPASGPLTGSSLRASGAVGREAGAAARRTAAVPPPPAPDARTRAHRTRTQGCFTSTSQRSGVRPAAAAPTGRAGCRRG